MYLAIRLYIRIMIFEGYLSIFAKKRRGDLAIMAVPEFSVQLLGRQFHFLHAIMSVVQLI